jgi:flavin-dependent dehydrogenase
MDIDQKLVPEAKEKTVGLELDDGSRVAVIGSGPAGSFFSYFLLDMAQRVGKDVDVDLYDFREFTRSGPAGCNMCGGIVSESLVQVLAAEGINLPPNVIQRGIDSYVVHMDVGSVRIETPLHEKRIGAVHRGHAPRGTQVMKWDSFDGYLQGLAKEKGARFVQGRVDHVALNGGRPEVRTREGSSQTYDLMVVAVGVNATVLRLFEGLGLGYQPPQTTQTFIREYFLEEEMVGKQLGSAMHVFLLNIPRLEFAALIPKGDYVSLCLLGEEVDKALIQSFMDAPEVKRCLPPDLFLEQGNCQCSPRISVQGAIQPFADRVVFVGDCGVTRLYKDGIGAAYRTAKAAAATAAFHGISGADFKKHYWPACQNIGKDNGIGKVIFAITREIQKRRWARNAVFRMVSSEQRGESSRRRMSTVLWDMFTGSAPYKEIFLRTLHPLFVCRLVWDMAISLLSVNKRRQ